MIVYHGGTAIIEKPIAAAGRERLDFGRGFYVTDIQAQAKLWAERMQRIREEKGIVNIYELDLDNALRELSKYRPNNQLCITSQAVIDECLKYIESYNI